MKYQLIFLKIMLSFFGCGKDNGKGKKVIEEP
jgi:hypothetical protein